MPLTKAHSDFLLDALVEKAHSRKHNWQHRFVFKCASGLLTEDDVNQLTEHAQQNAFNPIVFSFLDQTSNNCSQHGSSGAK